MFKRAKTMRMLFLIICSTNIINSKVTIYRCCPPNRCLIANQCEDYDTSKWALVVYSPENQSLLALVTIPDDFEFVDKKPECSQMLHFLDATNAVLTADTGSLFADGLVLPPNTFCISSAGSIGCLNEDHSGRKKTEKTVRKCCSTGHVYSEMKGTCVQNQTNFLSDDTYVHAGFPICESKDYAIIGRLGNKYSLNVDGTLNAGSGSPITEYCVEYIIEQTHNDTNKTEASVFICSDTFPLVKPDGDDIRYTLYPVGFFFSCFFLTFTLISSFMLPTTYHALHWKCQMHYVACLLVGDFLLAVTQLASDSMKHNFMLCTGIDAYGSWPEMEAVIKQKNRICRHFLIILNVFKEARKVTASICKITLHYRLNKNRRAYVQGLKCNIPFNPAINTVKDLILSRSPSTACVLLLAPLKWDNCGWVGDHYQITGEHCDSEYEPRSTPTTNESTNEKGSSGQDSQVTIIPKVKINREANEEVHPRPGLIMRREKNKEKLQKGAMQEILDEDEVEPSEMDNRRIRNLATPKRERDDCTKQGKKRIHLD